jgi:SAM-dependent methyltransferase
MKIEQDKQSRFDRSYFHTGPYAQVSFDRYSQYWWSNRFYALLARRYGPDQGKVLEVGCGLGHLLGWLSDRYQVYGTDINPWALVQAKHNVPRGNYARVPAEDLSAFVGDTFQIVVAKHVLEHLPHPERAIAEISRVLAPGGILLAATPNLDSPMRALKKERWVGFKDPTHISLERPQRWLELLRAEGLRPRRVFSDGFWDAPYLPWIPTFLQKLFFGAPGGLQAILALDFLPLWLGESMIVIADKKNCDGSSE